MMKRTLLASAGFTALLAATFTAPDVGLAATAEAPATAAADATAGVEEVVVTAEKREGKLLQTPVPVTVVAAQSLAETGLVRMRDFYLQVPGLNLQPNFYAQQTLTIRGISTGSSHPTVGLIVDDVPFGGSTNQTSGFWLPDLDPGDLQRVEVLRGPQGTLYGANSMGGLINFVTKEPSTTQASGEMTAGVSNTAQDVGYLARGAGNIPINDTLAVRFSAFYRRDPGYIDNVVYNIKDANKSDNGGAYFTMLWRPSPDFSARFSSIFQTTQSKAPSEVDKVPGYNDLEQNYLPSVHGSDNRSYVESLHLDGQIAGIKLTSVTGYSVNDTEGSIDWSSSFAPAVFKAFGVSGAPFFNHTIVRRETQEFRASGEILNNIDWLAGAFYSHEIVNGKISMPATNTVTGQVVGNYRYGDYSSNGFTVDSLAGFFDFTYHFTSKFDLQVGGRYTGDRLARPITYTYGQYVVDSLHSTLQPFPTAAASTSDTAFTYLVTPRYKVSEDLMVYARFASGYRPGGPNGQVPNGIPVLVQPDYTNTYEAGLKGRFLDGKLTVDTSIYHIDWRNIQLNFFDTSIGLSYSSNGGQAKSDGVELAVVYKPWTGASLNASASVMNAVLTQDMPKSSTVQGKKGDPLSNASPFSDNIAFNQDFRPIRDFTPFAGVSYSFVGARKTILVPANAPRETYPAYDQIDLRAGLRGRDWSANVYVNNVGDVRGILSGGPALEIPPYAYVINTPRTVGFSVTHNF